MRQYSDQMTALLTKSREGLETVSVLHTLH